MGAEFVAAMSDAGSFTFEHDVTRIVPGEVESVRARLAGAMEDMGYSVLNENPIQARRSAKCGAQTGCSQDILDYHASLDVGLKSAGSNSTRVVFAYTIKGLYTGYLTKGDRNTLTREAEAIIALAASRAGAHHCQACGAETAGARFCRQCGAPITASNPAEVELLRLTADANVSYKNIVAGIISIALGILLPLLIYLFKQDTMSKQILMRMMTLFVGIGGGTGLIFLLMGLWRLNRVVKRESKQDHFPEPSRRPLAESAGVPDTAELLPPSIQHPITEATTDLLPNEARRAN
jgi:hypothetical protein